MDRVITETLRAWLVAELNVWRDLGLVDDDQERALLGLYATPDDLGRQRQSRALGILSTLAALMVGLGVMLLIAYNWDAMAAPVKVALILVGLVTVHSVGLHLKFRQGRAAAGEVAFFLGCLLYGAGIWLIAQIFHLSAHDGAAWWWWAAGVLPFALASNSLALHALYAALLAAWVGVEILGYSDLGGWLMFGRWRGVPNGAYGLLAMIAPGIVWAYRKRDPRALGLYLPVVVWWLLLQPYAWHLSAWPVHSIGAVGGLLLLVAGLHRDGNPMAIPPRVYGVVLTALVLVPLSFHAFNDFLDPQNWGSLAGDDPLGLLMLIAVLAAAVLALAVVIRRHRAAAAGEVPLAMAEELRALFRRQWLPVGVIAGTAALAMWRASRFEAGALVPTVVANVAMVVLSLWLIQLGLRDDYGIPFGTGVLYFLLWTVLRYIDLFGILGGMIGAALMFFECGATLLAVVWFWRKRNVAKTEVPHAAV